MGMYREAACDVKAAGVACGSTVVTTTPVAIPSSGITDYYTHAKEHYKNDLMLLARPNCEVISASTSLVGPSILRVRIL